MEPSPEVTAESKTINTAAVARARSSTSKAGSSVGMATASDEAVPLSAVKSSGEIRLSSQRRCYQT